MTRAQPVGRILGRVIKEAQLEKELQGARAVAAWPEIVGGQLSRVSRADRLDDGILHVRVHSGVWAQQLSLAQPQLLERYRDRVDSGTVRGFRFFVGSVPPGSRDDTGGAEPADSTPQTKAKEQLSPESREKLGRWENKRRRELDEINDPGLRLRVDSWLTVMRGRRAKGLMAGGRLCSRCGAVIAGAEELCPACLLELSSTAREKLRELLSEMPWLRTADLLELVAAADRELVKAVRCELKAGIKREVTTQVAQFLGGQLETGPARAKLKGYIAITVMLETGERPGELTRETVFSVLGPQAAAAWGRLSEGENRQD